MRFSYCMLPDYPLDESIEMIKTADELGFHAVYAVDETWHKDLWVLFAAAATLWFMPELHAAFLMDQPAWIQLALIAKIAIGGGLIFALRKQWTVWVA